MQDLLHIREDDGAERFIPLSQAEAYRRDARARGRAFDVVEDWEVGGERYAITQDLREDFLAKAQASGRAPKRLHAMADARETQSEWRIGEETYLIPEARRGDFLARARATGRTPTPVGPKRVFLDDAAREEALRPGFDTFDFLESFGEGFKFPVRLAGSVAQGFVALPTFFALGGEWALGKAGAMPEGSRPVSDVGFRLLQDLEQAKPEYNFARTPGTWGAIARGATGALELGGAIAGGGSLDKSVRAVHALVTGQAARQAAGLAPSRAAAESAAIFRNLGGTAAERRAMDYAFGRHVDDLIQRAAAAGAAGAAPAAGAAESLAQGGRALGEAYLRRLPFEQFREGVSHFARTAARPNYWKLAIPAQTSLETYLAYSRSGHGEDRAMLATLGDAALSYLFLALGDGVGAFGDAAIASGLTQFMRSLSAASKHPWLRAELAGSALRVLGGAASEAGATEAHLRTLQGALGEETLPDEEILAQTVLSALFGGAVGGAQSIAPIRRAIAQDKYLAAMRERGAAGGAPGSAGAGPRESGIVNRESPAGQSAAQGAPGAPTPAPDASGIVPTVAPAGAAQAANPSGLQPSAVGPRAGQADLPALFRPVAVLPTGDVRFASGALFRADTQTFLMPNGAVVDTEGNIQTVAPPEAASSASRESPIVNRRKRRPRAASSASRPTPRPGRPKPPVQRRSRKPSTATFQASKPPGAKAAAPPPPSPSTTCCATPTSASTMSPSAKSRSTATSSSSRPRPTPAPASSKARSSRASSRPSPPSPSCCWRNWTAASRSSPGATASTSPAATASPPSPPTSSA